MRFKVADKCLAKTINPILKERQQWKDSSPSWMIRNGVRRFYPDSLWVGKIAKSVDKHITKFIVFILFPCRLSFGKGMWLTTDCNVLLTTGNQKSD